MTGSTTRWAKRVLTTTVFSAMIATLMVAPAQAEDQVDDPVPPVVEEPAELLAEESEGEFEAESEVGEADPTEAPPASAEDGEQLPDAAPGPAADGGAFEGPSVNGNELPDKSGLIDGELRGIYDRWVAGEPTPEVSDGTIRVEVIPATTFKALAAALAAFGAVDTVNLDTENEFGGLAVSTLAVDDLIEIEALPEVTQLRMPLVLTLPEPEVPEELLGEEVESGVAEAASPIQKGKAGKDLISRVRSAKWSKAGVKGAGVKVGIIDYFGKSRWNAAQSRGDVKKPSGAFCRINGKNCNIWSQGGNSEHGVGVAEAILDVAPSAKIYIASVQTMEDHKAAVNYFAKKGVRIISRSLAAELDGRGDGTGPAASVLNHAVKKKITWFNSAGNHGVQKMPYNDYGFEKRGGYWRGEWRDLNGNGLMDFTPPPGSGLPTDGLYGTCSYFQGMRWNDWTGTPTDYDLWVYAIRGFNWEVIKKFETTQKKGVKPLEVGSIPCSNGELLAFVIRKYENGNGTSNDRIELMTNGMFFDHVRNDGSASQPFVDTKNPGGLGVGSIDVVTKKPEPNSARGPLIDGRVKPDISAAANFTTTAYLTDNPKGRFNGTSSATPAAAGAAALILSKNKKWSAQKLGKYMRTHATKDRGKKGRDNTYGYGELRMPLLNSKKPKITGTQKAGKRLKVKAGKWTESVKRSYQWYRNGKKIKGAKSKSYKLKSSDIGKRITVVETAKKKGYKNAKAKSSKTKKITR